MKKYDDMKQFYAARENQQQQNNRSPIVHNEDSDDDDEETIEEGNLAKYMTEHHEADKDGEDDEDDEEEEEDMDEEASSQNNSHPQQSTVTTLRSHGFQQQQVLFQNRNTLGNTTTIVPQHSPKPEDTLTSQQQPVPQQPKPISNQNSPQQDQQNQVPVIPQHAVVPQQPASQPLIQDKQKQSSLLMTPKTSHKLEELKLMQQKFEETLFNNSPLKINTSSAELEPSKGTPPATVVTPLSQIGRQNSFKSLKIEDIPPEIQILLTQRVREELGTIVKQEMEKLKKESEVQLSKMRMDISSHSSGEIEKRVSEKLQQILPMERQKIDSYYKNLSDKAVRDFEERLQQDFDTKKKHFMEEYRKQIQLEYTQRLDEAKTAITAKLRAEHEHESKQMKELYEAKIQELVKKNEENELAAEKKQQPQQQQPKKDGLNSSLHISDLNEEEEVKNEGEELNNENQESGDEELNPHETSAWIDLNPELIATKLIEDARVGRTIVTTKDPILTQSKSQKNLLNLSMEAPAVNTVEGTAPQPQEQVAQQSIQQPSVIHQQHIQQSQNQHYYSSGHSPSHHYTSNTVSNMTNLQMVPPIVPQGFKQQLNFELLDDSDSTTHHIEPKQQRQSLSTGKKEVVSNQQSLFTKTARHSSPPKKKSEMKKVMSYQTALANSKPVNNPPANMAASSKNKQSTGPKSQISQHQQQAQVILSQIAEKESLINKWKQSEVSNHEHFKDYQAATDKLFKANNGNNDIVNAFARLKNLLTWIYTYWNNLEISNVYRREFLQVKVLVPLTSSSQNPQLQQRMIEILTSVENSLTAEVNRLNDLLPNVSNELSLVARREAVKLQLEELRHVTKDSRKLAMEAQLAGQVAILSKQISPLLKAWEKKFKTNFTFKGFRYLDLLDYDSLLLEKEKFEADQADMQKRVRRLLS